MVKIAVQGYEHQTQYYETDQMGIISLVLEVNCVYKSMVHFGDAALIIPKIERYNGVKLELSYRILDKESGELRTTGSSHCFLNREGRPISLKKDHPVYDAAFRRALIIS